MSNYALALTFKAETLRTLGFASIPNNSYVDANIGGPFINPIRQIYIQNLTNQQLTYSFDGVHDHFVLPTMGFLLLDITANKTHQGGWWVAEGSRIYVTYQGVAPSSGAAYVSAFYGATGY